MIFNCHAKNIEFNASQLPAEFSKLLNSIEMLALSNGIKEEQAKRLSEDLKLINATLGYVDRSQFLFLTKTNIFQTLLLNKWNVSRTPIKLSTGRIQILKENLKAMKATLSPLTDHYLTGVIIDAEKIMNDSNFKFINQSKTNNRDVINLKREFKLLSPSLAILDQYQAETLEKETFTLYLNIISQMAKSLQFIGEHAHHDAPAQVDFFIKTADPFFPPKRAIKQTVFKDKANKEGSDSLKNQSESEAKKANELVQKLTIKKSEQEKQDSELPTAKKDWKPKDN